MRKKSKKADSAEKKLRQSDLSRRNTARALFFINATLWLGYAAYIYYDMAVMNNNRSSAYIATVYVVLNAIVLFVSGIQLGKLRKSTYYFALVVVVANTLLAVLNISDLFFLTVFILDLFILFVIFLMRKTIS